MTTNQDRLRQLSTRLLIRAAEVQAAIRDGKYELAARLTENPPEEPELHSLAQRLDGHSFLASAKWSKEAQP